VGGVWSILKFAARAAMWRTTPDPPHVGLSVLVGWTLVLAFVRLTIQLADALPSPAFTPYGLNALVAWLVIALVVAAFFVAPKQRVTVLSAMVALSVLTEVVFSTLRIAFTHLLPSSEPSAVFFSVFPALNTPRFATLVELGLSASLFLAPAVSWSGGMFAIVRSVQPDVPLRLLGKVIALWAALFVAKGLIPHAPVFAGPGFDIRTANAWEYVRARYLAPKPPADIAVTGTVPPGNAQAALLRAEVSRLVPQQQGVTDIYGIGIAGWSDLDVFVKEVDGAFEAIAQILPIRDRTLRLVNSPETVETDPHASRRNFAAAVHAVAEVMDRDEDVLLLVMSSHGTAAGFSLQLPGGTTQLLTPHEVKAVLDEEGIKNRIVIVSACFSGAFVAPLANDDTIVLTAADEKSTSFGCAAGRDWTYFGDAFFRQGLRRGTDFQRAFDHARLLIRSWEMMDRLPPSNPLAHFGSALVGKLEPVLEATARGSQ
jgi:hypothetical protein